MFCFLDSIPVVGHVKAGVHYAVGDDAGGRNAMVQATRSTAVLTGGAVGAVIGGPIGMVTGAALVVAAADSVTSDDIHAPWGFDAGVAGHPTSSVTEIKRSAKTGMDQTSMEKTGMVQTSMEKTEMVQKSLVKTRMVQASIVKTRMVRKSTVNTV
ncbi:uncharacterized protein LOC123879470 [Maniola jurtina]|uniref:uncharacterized protein LOC123879470 n=1 Tax=Maniola jurtina TaxID=191418 RepID=UPI001E68657E|nr:uncharacterized protein LOC123879470 [Maniola jurtina]XP_045783132.1 uncharacterized protein LOC123879470 [Maniola jurtina]